MRWRIPLLVAMCQQQAPTPAEAPLDANSPPSIRRPARDLIHPPTFVDRRELYGRKAAQRAAMSGDEMVIGVTLGDAVRAYPIARIALDEVMNDTVDDVAIAITW